MIKVGDRVRSFDFPRRRDVEGELACFVEGTVVGFEKHEGCKRYKLQVRTRVFGGKPLADNGDGFVYPPVNGTPTPFGDKTDYVEAI